MSILKSTLKLTLLDEVSAGAKRMSSSLARLNEQATRSMSPLRGIAAQAIAFGGAYLGIREGMQATVGAAISFETAFSNVKKVISATDTEFSGMRRTIIDLSKQLPMTAIDIASIYEAAGQSGIANNDLARFTEMAVKVGVAWDMTASETGESLAKLQTGLGLTLDQTMSLADAINYLGNNGASSNRDILEVTKRVGPMGKQFGFSAEQIAALGSAMTGAGFEAEVASTTILNVGRALTKGSSATKRQESAFKSLGLTSTKVAKSMLKDGVGTLKDVLARINKIPASERAALINNLFGDEARALGPLITNGKLLADTMDLVGDKSKYAGSAFGEYTAQANTTANVLSLLRNKFWAFFEEMGARWLPTVKNAALGIGDILDTLGERATIFDQLGAGISGFMNGIGEGNLRDVIHDLGDLLLGPADGSAAADKLGSIFARFQQWGKDTKEFYAALKDNEIVKFFEAVAPYGGKLFLWGVGFTTLAGAVGKLASALFLLSGASTALGIIKTLGTVASIVGGGAAATGVSAASAAGAGAAGAASAGLMARLLGFARLGLLGMAAGGAYVAGKETYTGDTPYSQGKSLIPAPTDVIHAVWQALASIQAPPSGKSPAEMAGQRGTAYSPLQAAVDGANSPGRTGVVSIDAASISAMIQPSGVQQVAVTNQQPVSVQVSNSFTITEAASAQATAAAVAAKTGEAAKKAVEASFGGGGGF